MTMATTTPRKRTTAAILQLRIELRGTKPKIWRRVLVPQTITLRKLHSVIRAAFGWSGGHLHEFVAVRGAFPRPVAGKFSAENIAVAEGS